MEWRRADLRPFDRPFPIRFAAFVNSASMRDSHPQPLARKAASVLRLSRKVSGSLVGAFCGPRARGYWPIKDASFSGVKNSLAGSVRASSSSVNSQLSETIAMSSPVYGFSFSRLAIGLG